MLFIASSAKSKFEDWVEIIVQLKKTTMDSIGFHNDIDSFISFDMSKHFYIEIEF